MIKILIVDDHPVVRHGLSKILNNEPHMEVKGEAKDVKELFDFLENNEVDVVILDISMPDGNGLEALTKLKKQQPELPVLILSVHSEEQYAMRVLKSGGAGYLTKESAPDQLVNAINKVVGGGKYVSPSLAEKLAFELESGEQPSHENLSNREFQVLSMIASGMTVKEISDKLYLSVKTVSTYRSRILNKMNLKTNAELTHYAIKNKLVD